MSAAHSAITKQHLLVSSHALLLSTQGGKFNQKLLQGRVCVNGWDIQLACSLSSKVHCSILHCSIQLALVATLASSLQSEPQLYIKCSLLPQMVLTSYDTVNQFSLAERTPARCDRDSHVPGQKQQLLTSQSIIATQQDK